MTAFQKWITITPTRTALIIALLVCATFLIGKGLDFYSWRQDFTFKYCQSMFNQTGLGTLTAYHQEARATALNCLKFLTGAKIQLQP